MINSGMMSTNLTELGQARGQLLSIKLDKASTGSVVANTSSVNKEGYMTDLDSLSFNSGHEINDIKKARALLKSVITSNPNSASGWIAAARVEELDGKIQQARNIMA
jgi:pre-mRNA-processing factor 6